ncbi:MAG: hypothetical protein JRJ66_13880 [Deltaproteobacteria bacterium]|nr:hypothetical protein [Deltaproteobacteria bacterium]
MKNVLVAFFEAGNTIPGFQYLGDKSPLPEFFSLLNKPLIFRGKALYLFIGLLRL